MSPYSLILSRL